MNTTRVFIAYDFEIRNGITDQFEWVRKNAAPELSVEYPGAPNGRSQGEIWRDIVEPKLRWAERVIAYVDLPNANVGFEIGYTLGLGTDKQVALARVRPTIPAWLNDPPFSGFLCPHLATAKELLELVRRDELLSTPARAAGGRGVLVLCPPKTGELYTDEVKELKPDWQRLPLKGWTLKDIPELLKEIGSVVWIVPPHHGGPDARDGVENAAASVLAGYAAGAGLRLKTLIHAESRVVVDVVSKALPFKNVQELRELIEQIAAEVQSPDTTDSPQVRPPRTRPNIVPLPAFDQEGEVDRLFIGRAGLLGDHRDALRGLVARANGETPTGAAAVQAAWFHGFGGMGKSWFLRKALLMSRDFQDVRMALLDWDTPKWGAGRDGVPGSAQELFHAIAIRLAQLYGPEQLDPYWLAEQRVEEASAARRDLRVRFNSELDALGRGERRDAVLERRDTAVLESVLRSQGLWPDSPSKREGALDRVRRDLQVRDQAFRRWFEAGGGGSTKDRPPHADALCAPDELLRAGLRDAIQACSKLAPLLVGFDTCELLTPELDMWLRAVIAPLCDGRSAVLFLIASRLPPDVGEDAGSRRGWRAEVGDELWRRVPFDHDVHFTVKEASTALERVKRRVHDLEETAERLHTITRGVPLALRTLLDLHEQGDPVLQELEQIEEGVDQQAEGEQAIDKVVEVLASRFLLHLERKAGREQDLEDIVALGLLTHAHGTVLAKLWGGSAKRAARLRELANRYSLLCNGDLHATVRSFLRRRWRSGGRPVCFDKVLDSLWEAFGQQPVPELPDEGAMMRVTERLNLLSWKLEEGALAAFAPAIALSLAFDEEPGPILTLALELPAENRTERKAMSALRALLRERERYSWRTEIWGNDEILRWLEDMGDKARWNPLEEGALALLSGLQRANLRDFDAAHAFLVRARDRLGARLPRVDEMGEAFYNVGFGLVDRYGWRQAESAFQHQADLGYLVAEAKNALGLVRYNCGDARGAEQRFREAMNLAPKEPVYASNLGTALREQRQWDQAVAAYDIALGIDRFHVNGRLGLCLVAAGRGDVAGAEAAIRKTMAESPSEALFACALGDLLREKTKRWDEAEVAYRKALELDERHLSALSGLGLLAQARGRLQEAEGHLQKAIELDPHDPAWRVHLGQMHREKTRRWDEAEAAYRKAIELDPSYAYAFIGLGLLERARGRMAQAESYLRKVMELQPNEPAWSVDLGHLLRWKTRRWQEAEEAYRKAIELDAKCASAFNGLGLLEQARGRVAEAESYLRKAIELEPNEPAWPVGLGHLLRRKTRRWQEAEEAYRKAIELDANHASAFNGLGLLEQARGRVAEAESYLRKAIELEPNEPAWPVDLGHLLQWKTRRWQEAEEAYRKAIELDANHASAFNGLGLLEQARGRVAEAESYLRKAIELEPNEPAWPVDLGHLLQWKTRRWQEAEEAYRKAIELDANHASASNGLGLLEQARGRVAEAESYLRKAIELEPNEPAWPVDLGHLLRRKTRRWQEAEEAYRKAIELDANHASASNGLGLLEQARGRVAEAESYLRKAIELEPNEPAWPVDLGHLLRRKTRRWQEAEEAYRKAIELDANHASASNGLGLLEQARGRVAEAESYLRKAIELEPNEPAWLSSLGYLLRLKTRRWDEAEGAYRRAIELDANDAYAFNGLGLLEQARGRVAEAESHLRKAIELAPTEPAWLVDLGHLLREKTTRWDEAGAAWRKAIELNPSCASAFNGLGLLEQLRGRTPEAESHLRKAMELEPSEPAWSVSLGHLLRQETSRWNEAEAAYRTAIELDPSLPTAFDGLGRLEGSRGRAAEAESYLRKAIELAPFEPAYLVNLGDLLREKTRRWDEATAMYRKALELDRRCAAAMLGLGLFEQARGRVAEAEEHIRNAMELEPSEPQFPFALGNLLEQSAARYAEACEAYEGAASLAPEHPSILGALAQLEAKAGRPGRALRELRRIHSERTHDPEAAHALGSTLFELSLPAEGETVLRGGLERHPSNASLLNALAWGLAKSERALDEAASLAGRAVELEPESPNYLHTQAHVEVMRGHPDMLATVRRWRAASTPWWIYEFTADIGKTFGLLLVKDRGGELLGLLRDGEHASTWADWATAIEAKLRPEVQSSLPEACKSLYAALGEV